MAEARKIIQTVSSALDKISKILHCAYPTLIIVVHSYSHHVKLLLRACAHVGLQEETRRNRIKRLIGKVGERNENEIIN